MKIVKNKVKEQNECTECGNTILERENIFLLYSKDAHFPYNRLCEKCLITLAKEIEKINILKSEQINSKNRIINIFIKFFSKFKIR